MRLTPREIAAIKAAAAHASGADAVVGLLLDEAKGEANYAQPD